MSKIKVHELAKELEKQKKWSVKHLVPQKKQMSRQR